MIDLSGYLSSRQQVYDVMKLLELCQPRRKIAGLGRPRAYYSEGKYYNNIAKKKKRMMW